jgi:hypothetical protein
MRTASSWLLAVALAAAPFVAHAEPAPPAKSDGTKRTVETAAKTTVDAVVDGARTVGRSAKSLVEDGAPAAKRTWKKNAQLTKDDARQNAAATRAAAK